MRKKYRLRKGLTLTAVLLLGVTGVMGGVYAYYTDNLQIETALKTGAMDVVFDQSTAVDIGITNKRTGTSGRDISFYASALDTYSKGKSASFAIAGEIDERVLQKDHDLLTMQLEAYFTADSVIDRINDKYVDFERGADFTAELWPENPELKKRTAPGYYQLEMQGDRVLITIYLQLKQTIAEIKEEKKRGQTEAYTCTIPVFVEQYRGNGHKDIPLFSYAYFMERLEVTARIPFAYAEEEEEPVKEDTGESAAVTGG